MQSTVNFECSVDKKCLKSSAISPSSAMLDDQGKCSALLTRKGFFDFVIFRTHCNIFHSVGVVCQHDQKQKSEFSNNMSDIKVSMADGYSSLQVFSSCEVGWFMVDDIIDMCINIYPCMSIKSFEERFSCVNNNEAQEHCIKYGGHLAHRVLNNVTITEPSNTLNKNTKLSLFWDMFHHIDDIRSLNFDNAWRLTGAHRKYIAVNGSGLCGHFNMADHCIDSNIALLVPYYIAYYLDYEIFDTSNENNWYSTPWSLIRDIHLQTSTSKTFTLCEKSTDHSGILNSCSEFYMSCNDGTCVHDSLVCDGYPHCPHGEDETDCQHSCSDHTNNCMFHCHLKDLCSCSSEYFQCLPGGCVNFAEIM